jgi:hypothetical protein
MKFVALLSASLGLAAAFMTAPPQSRSVTSLQMGLLDGLFPLPAKKPAAATSSSSTEKETKKKSSDKWIENMFKAPLHGHGSAEKDLEDMYAAQQNLLKERRQLFGESGAMRNKYQDPKVDHLRDIQVHRHDPAMLNKKEDDAMYFGDNDVQGFSFNPFKGKLKP